MQPIPFVAAFGAAQVVASFVEYAAHRAMHRRWLIPRRHANHHRSAEGQGVFPEMLDYAGATVPLLPLGFVLSTSAGAGFAAGGLFYALVAAWAHQLHHERPELVFWMRTPTHHVHHAMQLTRANFGVTSDFWDRVFGTWLPVDLGLPRRPPRLRELFRVRWGWSGGLRSPWRRPSRRQEEPR